MIDTDLSIQTDSKISETFISTKGRLIKVQKYPFTEDALLHLGIITF